MKAILFDHDGVLADSETLFFNVTRSTFERHGYDLSPMDWARLYLGESYHSDEIAQIIGVPDDEIDSLISTRNEIYRRKLSEGVPLIDGVPQAIDQLAENLRLAIVTGCPRRQIDSIHSGGDFLRRFELVITADDCRNTKPDPEPYLRALSGLNLEPHDCLAVEDSPRGLASAQAAGLRVILIPTALTDMEQCRGAWRVCPDISHALTAIQSWM